MIIRTYSDLIAFDTFYDRFEYLKLSGEVGSVTFGHDRWFNQKFYTSEEWLHVRAEVIARDNGCDLGIAGYEINDRVYVHHMNPIRLDDIIKRSEMLLNPEYLIATTFRTHNAIHYGDVDLLVADPIERKPNDTCPWKH